MKSSRGVMEHASARESARAARRTTLAGERAGITDQTNDNRRHCLAQRGRGGSGNLNLWRSEVPRLLDQVALVLPALLPASRGRPSAPPAGPGPPAPRRSRRAPSPSPRRRACSTRSWSGGVGPASRPGSQRVEQLGRHLDRLRITLAGRPLGELDLRHAQVGGMHPGR